jgi:NTE family protein
MLKRLTFVLGGGGSRGAMQVGALQACLEAGIHPDLLVGTSAGAINAAFIAMHGYNRGTLEELGQLWVKASGHDLLPANYLWLTLKLLFKYQRSSTENRLREFFIEHGLTPDLRFGDIGGPKLVLVATDLTMRCCLQYGDDPDESVLEGVVASTALPPWVDPIEIKGRLLLDGGLLSDLPIEPALNHGAREILALDLSDPLKTDWVNNGYTGLITNLIAAVNQRQIDLEMALASARRVPVHHICLHSPNPIPIWDFSRTQELIEYGYEYTLGEIERRKIVEKNGKRSWFPQLW